MPNYLNKVVLAIYLLMLFSILNACLILLKKSRYKCILSQDKLYVSCRVLIEVFFYIRKLLTISFLNSVSYKFLQNFQQKTDKLLFSD